MDCQAAVVSTFPLDLPRAAGLYLLFFLGLVILWMNTDYFFERVMPPRNTFKKIVQVNEFAILSNAFL